MQTLIDIFRSWMTGCPLCHQDEDLISLCNAVLKRFPEKVFSEINRMRI